MVHNFLENQQNKFKRHEYIRWQMFNSPFLDVAISLAFIFFLLSVLTSAVTELIMSILAKRGKNLRWAIEEVFNDPQNKNWAELMYEHPMIDGLKLTESRLPTYISSEVFSMALIEVFIQESRDIKVDSLQEGKILVWEKYPSTYKEEQMNKDLPVEEHKFLSSAERSYLNFKEGIKRINPGDVQVLLKNFIYKSNNFDELRKNIQIWYDEYMERVSGWYKRELRTWLFFIGLIIAVIMNVDSIKLTSQLYNDRELRSAVVQLAEKSSQSTYDENIEKLKAAADTSNVAVSDSIQKITLDQITFIRSVYDTVNALKLPIGWDITITGELFKMENVNELFSFERVKKLLGLEAFLKLVGWIFTGIAVTFGAPFWFDAMKKFINVRNSGAKPPAVKT